MLKSTPREQTLTKFNFEAYRAQALSDIQDKVQELSGLEDGQRRGDNGFKAMCALGWSVAHKILSEGEFSALFLAAYVNNGLLKGMGRGSFEATVKRALKKSRSDRLPPLNGKFRNADRKESDLFLSQLTHIQTPVKAAVPDAPKAFYDKGLIKMGFNLAAVYKFFDDDGELAYEKLKYSHPTEKNRFLYRHTGQDGKLYRGKTDRPDYPYNLIDLFDNEGLPVIVCEGEKDADNAKGLGLLAVSVNDWEACSKFFDGRDVVLVPDNDKAGRDKAEVAIKALVSVAKSVCVVNLPGLPEKGDFTDWLQAGGNRLEFEVMMRIAQSQAVQNTDIENIQEKLVEKNFIGQKKEDCKLSEKGEFMLERSQPDLIVKEIGRILSETGTVFTMGGEVIELQDIPVLPGEEPRHRISEVKPGRVQVLIHDKMRVTSFFKDEKKACSLPLLHCRTFLEQGTWKELQNLSAISLVPILREDGQIHSVPGYDDKTQLYLDIAPDGWDEVTDPLDVLMSPFKFFPWETPEDQAIHLAALITAVIRPTLRTAPAFCYSATEAGSGKTLLATCCGILANGRTPTVVGYSYDNNEVDKQVDGFLLSGQSVVVFDNLNRAFGNDKICTLLTSPHVEVRRLGGSAVIRTDNKLMIFATGNGLTLGTDMDRRSLICRLDVNDENPQNREFKFLPTDLVRINRKEMVMAALQLIRAVMQKGPVTRRVGSFEDWGVVSDAVFLALGIDVGERLRVPEMVPEEKMNFSILVSYWGENKLGKLTAKKIAQAYEERHGSLPQRQIIELAEIIGLKDNARSIGRFLQKGVGRVANGWKLIVELDAKRGNSYEVIKK